MFTGAEGFSLLPMIATRPLDRREGIKLIHATFQKLERCCEGCKEWPQYLKLIREEERQHRTGTTCLGVPDALPLGRAVEHFAAKSLFERFVPGHEKEKQFTPSAEDYFWVKHSIFAACAVAKICAPEIRAKFSLREMRDYLDQLDYARLNDPQQS